MSPVNKLLSAILACAVGGCAIHPLPQDVTGVKTSEIVRKIRCEARQAVIDGRIRWLQQRYHQVTDLASLRQVMNSSTLDPRTRYWLDYYGSTGIVYSFVLDGTETAGANFTADIVRPLTNSTTTITPNLGDSLSRDNIRTFTIGDSFGGLLEKKMDGYCASAGESGPNYQYPIVGRIGIDEMIQTFIELAPEGLQGAQNPDASGLNVGASTISPSNPIAMVDTITFTTTVSAGVTPKVVFVQIGTNWQLADATLPLAASRMDKHQVFIGLALSGPPAPPVLVVRGGRQQFVAQHQFRAESTAATARTPRVVSTMPTTPGTGVSAALEAVNQQILRFEVPKSLIVAP
jgi:hypothetical protein